MRPRQGESIAPRILPPQQCPGCAPGNSLPLAPGEPTCDLHAWWSADNGAASNIIENED